MPRKDFKAIKYLYQEFGLKTAMEWQRLPLIEIPKITIDDLDENNPMRREPPSLVGIFDYLPWNDASYLDGSIVFRLKRIEVDNCTDAVELSVIFLDDEPVHDMVLFDNRAGHIVGYDDHSTMANDKIAVSLLTCAAVAIQYLSQCPEHLVEVRSIGTQQDAHLRRKAAKTAQKKPWLREGLPSIILLDPTQAKAYGHRINRGGSHASPIPHQRRGHWRHLKADRFKSKRPVWVRPAWIGDKEWVFNGNTYKVLSLQGSDIVKDDRDQTSELG